MRVTYRMNDLRYNEGVRLFGRPMTCVPLQKRAWVEVAGREVRVPWWLYGKAAKERQGLWH